MMRHSWAVVCGVAVAACGSSPPQSIDAAGSSDAVANDGRGIAGLLTDSTEQPLPMTDVLACTAAFCLFGASDATGHFRFDFTAPTAVALKTHEDLARNPRRAAALVPLQVSDTLIDVGMCYVPDLPAGAPIGPATADPQTLVAGDGLELTVRRADLTPPFGGVISDLAARQLPAAHIPVYPGLGGESVVAVFALHPFTATSSSPIAVRVPTTLDDGTVVKLRTISELDGSYVDVIAGKAMGGFITSDAGTGITRITYLVVSK